MPNQDKKKSLTGYLETRWSWYLSSQNAATNIFVSSFLLTLIIPILLQNQMWDCQCSFIQWTSLSSSYYSLIITSLHCFLILNTFPKCKTVFCQLSVQSTCVPTAPAFVPGGIKARPLLSQHHCKCFWSTGAYRPRCCWFCSPHSSLLQCLHFVFLPSGLLSLVLLFQLAPAGSFAAALSPHLFRLPTLSPMISFAAAPLQHKTLQLALLGRPSRALDVSSAFERLWAVFLSGRHTFLLRSPCYSPLSGSGRNTTALSYSCPNSFCKSFPV